MKMVSRRSFLKMAGVSALAIAGVSALAACSGGGTIPSGPSDLYVTLQADSYAIGEAYAKALNDAKVQVAYSTDLDELVKRVLSATKAEVEKNEALKGFDVDGYTLLGIPKLDTEKKILQVKFTPVMG